MKNKITSGIWFVFIGLILLLHNVGIIHFNVVTLLKYWPLLLILVGVDLLVQNKKQGLYVSIGATVLVLSFLFYKGISTPSSSFMETLIEHNSSVDIDSWDDNAPNSAQITEPLLPSDKEVSMTLNTGQSKITIGSAPSSTATSDHLFAVHALGGSTAFQSKISQKDEQRQVTLSTKSNTMAKQKQREVSLQLHAQPIWNLSLNCGATKVEGDLSDLRMRSVDINSGASKIDLKLGMPEFEEVTINIATGASKMHLEFPDDAAIQVAYSTILSNTTLKGFIIDKKEGIARTENYHSASKRYIIKLDGAANTFRISRY